MKNGVNQPSPAWKEDEESRSMLYIIIITIIIIQCGFLNCGLMQFSLMCEADRNQSAFSSGEGGSRRLTDEESRLMPHINFVKKSSFIFEIK